MKNGTKRTVSGTTDGVKIVKKGKGIRPVLIGDKGRMFSTAAQRSG